MKIATLLGLSLGLWVSISAPSQAASNKWTVDADASSLKFHLTNLAVPVNGGFSKLGGTVEYDGKNLGAAKIFATVAIDSIDSGIKMRDKHLKTKDFFDVGKFPQAEFRSTKIEVKPSGSFEITGNLSMHGISQPVVLEAAALKESTDATGHNHLTTVAAGTLERKSFKIGGLAAATISNDVKLDLTIDMVKD